MGDNTAIRVLGPLELWHANRPLCLPMARLQTMLQLLLLRVEQWCDKDELIDIIWDGRPPRSAAANLRTFVCQWRKVLEPLPDVAVIDSRRGGYRLNLRRGELDVHVFETLVADGHQALGQADAAQATHAFESALRLWRGIPFDLTGTHGFPERTRLTELRDNARTGLVTALLQTKRTDDAITVLQQAVAAQQFDERVWTRLIETLIASGRRAAALDAYRQIQTLLRDELGIDPGCELRSAHQKVLLGR